MSHKIKEQVKSYCSCGYEEGTHEVGEGNCCRYIVTDPDKIPRNRRKIYNPKWFKDNIWIWDVGDHWVTEYTLLHQRMYAKHDSGKWSRPKGDPSINSLKV